MILVPPASPSGASDKRNEAASGAAPGASTPAATAPPRLALILPGRSTDFALAADTVRAGFFAGASVGGADGAIEVIEIDEAIPQFDAALRGAAQRGAAVAVGPLTRTLANALGDGRIAAPLPLLTLTLPDSDAALGPDAIVFGLSIEQEARAVVRAALRELPPAAADSILAPLGAIPAPRFWIFAGASQLARRAGNAYREALRDAGERAVLIDVRVNYDVLQALAESIEEARPGAIFFALEARDAAAVKPRLPRDIPVYATSQVNLGGAEASLLAPDLEGIRFADAPWLLEPDHPAVMVYPHSEQPLSAELQRLYALGIDAYRLAALWASGRRAFDLDGVTGRLRVDRERTVRVERTPAFAVFHLGTIERLNLRP